MHALGEAVNNNEDDSMTERSRPETKSTAMCDQGRFGMGNGGRRLSGGR